MWALGIFKLIIPLQSWRNGDNLLSEIWKGSLYSYNELTNWENSPSSPALSLKKDFLSGSWAIPPPPFSNDSRTLGKKLICFWLPLLKESRRWQSSLPASQFQSWISQPLSEDEYLRQTTSGRKEAYLACGSRGRLSKQSSGCVEASKMGGRNTWQTTARQSSGFALFKAALPQELPSSFWR